MTQTAYTIVPAAAAYAGMIADSSPKTVLSRANAEGAAIPFGVAVARASDDTVDLPDGSDVIVGVTVRADHFDATLAGAADIPDKAVCSVMCEGVVWVSVEDACTEGGDVFVRHTGTGQVGGFLGTDDGTNSRLLAGAKWASSQASAGGLAKLRLFALTGATS